MPMTFSIGAISRIYPDIATETSRSLIILSFSFDLRVVRGRIGLCHPTGEPILLGEKDRCEVDWHSSMNNPG